MSKSAGVLDVDCAGVWLRRFIPNGLLDRLQTVMAIQKEPERLWSKGFVKEMSFKSGVKG